MHVHNWQQNFEALYRISDLMIMKDTNEFVVNAFDRDRGPYHIEISLLICSENQWTGFRDPRREKVNKLTLFCNEVIKRISLSRCVIRTPRKHLRWRYLQQQLTANKMLTIAAKLFILDVPRVLVKARLSSVVDYKWIVNNDRRNNW